MTESVATRFAAAVSPWGDRTALVSGQDKMTYRELDQLSSRIAALLLARGGTAAEPVVLLFNHDLPVVAALLGVIKSGKFYCALNPDDPILYQKKVLVSLGARLLLTHPACLQLAREIAPTGCEVIPLDPATLPASGSPLKIEIPAEALAGIFFTSGSTSTPKGVPRDHRSFLQRAEVSQRLYQTSQEDRLLLLHFSNTAPASNYTFEALFNGACLYLYDLKKRGLPGLVDLIKEEKISLLLIPLETLRYFLDSLPAGMVFEGTRWMSPTQDILYRKDVERIYRHFPAGMRINYVLGSSETGIAASHVITHGDALDEPVIPVGFPVGGKEILLLDENFHQAAPGQVGEIAVRSNFIFAGYWNLPDLNESKFIADPDNPQRKIYLSGDLGRFTGDGQLVFMGRKDFRVKIRGFNVDPPLVENVLMQVGAVRRAVVAARADPSGEKRLVAYILPQPGAELTVEMLRTVMAGKLADYMLPSFIVFMQQIPLLASGKVNSRALPDPAWDNPVLSSAYQPPRNQLEYRLAQLWRQILGVRQVGITDDFFELGGHSLQVVRLCAEIKTYFGKNISPAELIGCNTVACLAERLAEGNTPGEKNLLIPLQSGGTRPPLFVVPGIYGDVFYYLNLSAHLGSDQPVFGIQFYDSDGSLPADLVAMAAIFVEKIRAACPAGPYRLLGHSFGGHLAFAIAHNLAAGGEKVEFLGLLDTSFPTPLPAVTRGDRAREHLKNVLAQPPLNRPGYALGRLNARLLLLLKKASARLKAEKKPWGPDDVYTRNALALRNYAHPYYPGKICVFRVRDAQTQDYHPLISNWSNLAAEVEFYDAPGGHGNMLDEPYAAGLAELIQNALDGIG